METLRTISPVDGRVYVERPWTSLADARAALESSREAQAAWRHVSLAERIRLCARAVEALTERADELADEITWQMGRPRSQTPREVTGFAERAHVMLELAPDALAEIHPPPQPGATRFVRREPLGVVLAIVPWNYPYLTAANVVIPALAAGNAVLLKHSPQTPLCAERLVQAFDTAGLPQGLLHALHLTPTDTEALSASPGVDHVAFTGSLAVGLAVQRAAAGRLVGVGLELGGKDPAYVRPDAPLEATAQALVEGVFFNAGQSCCAVERIYVHRDVYAPMIEAFVEGAQALRLGNPFDREVNLGPLVSATAAERVRGTVREAVAAGARPLLDAAAFRADEVGTAYLAPQVLVDVDPAMRVLREETFGPAVGILAVRDDDEAVERMNDSTFGLTASVWTEDAEIALALGERVACGTWLANRCDVVDPYLAWTGFKDSGRGCTLSRVGYEMLTRPRSFHLRFAG